MCNLSQAVKEIGIEIGKKEGISQGIDIGRSEGINIGRTEGISIGRSEGIDIGRTEGISIGRTEGIQIGESKAKRNLSLSLFERGMAIDEIATLLGESIALVQEWLNGSMPAVE